MPEMQPLKPCARCEQELPESFFNHREVMFCKRCNQEVSELLSKKYTIIETALFRAKLRRKSRQLKEKMGQRSASVAAVGAGD